MSKPLSPGQVAALEKAHAARRGNQDLKKAQIEGLTADMETLKRLVRSQANEIERLSAERLSRDQESRAMDDIHEEYDDLWEPEGVLDVSKMPPRPGFVQRWVRTMQTGASGLDDATNLARRYNQGWRPRPASTIPAGVEGPTIKFGKYGDVIGVQGMILMERDERLHERYVRRIRQDTDALERSVKQNYLNLAPKVKGIEPEVKLKHSMTRGKPVQVAEDD